MAGEILKKRREELGLNITQIAEQLRIRADYLSSIEQDQFDKLPAPVYTVGYIRNYARHLNIDPAEVIRVYSERLPQPKVDTPAIPLVLADKKRPVLLYAVLVVLAAAAGAWLYLRTSQTEVPQQQPLPRPGQHATAGSPSTSQPNVIGRKTEERVEPTVEAPPAAVNPLPLHKEPPQTAPVSAAPVPATPPAASTPGAGKNAHLLSIKAVETTWVSVRFSDGGYEQATIRPGLSKEWGFSGTVSVRIGNAGGVSLSLDGKELGPVGLPQQVVTLTLPEQP